jgi:hypothetical protein
VAIDLPSHLEREVKLGLAAMLGHRCCNEMLLAESLMLEKQPVCQPRLPKDGDKGMQLLEGSMFGRACRMR